MKAPREQSGFSMIEVLVAISISTIFFTAAALVFQNVVNNRKRLATIESVNLGEETISNFYGMEDTSAINVYSAPNYGRSAFASELRERFQDDISRSSAVYALGRSGLNSIRPSTISYPAGSPLLDSPSDFLALLQTVYGASADVFVDYEGLSSAEDASIYLIEPGDSATELEVVAVYDLDVVSVNDDDGALQGKYVSVRRYVDEDLANYYDVFYPAASGNAFSPLVVHLSRAGLANHETDASAAKFMAAGEGSFYLMWWPDPAAHALEASSPPSPTSPPYDANDPIMSYWKMGGRSSFMFTVPMFPGLY